MTEYGTITIDPQGATLSVDVLVDGSRASAYTDAAGTSAASLPLTVSSSTTLYVRRWRAYTIVAELNGVEVHRETVGVARPANDPTVTVGLSAFTTGEAAAALAGFTAQAEEFRQFVQGLVGSSVVPDAGATSFLNNAFALGLD